MAKYVKDKRATATGSKNSWKSNHGDILDLALLDPEYGGSASTSELNVQLKTFFFASHDTTASAISWAYYFLRHHPKELAHVRKELDSVFGFNTTPRDVAQMLIANAKLHRKL